MQPDRTDLPPNISDHDLLIVLHTSMQHISKDVREIKDDNTRRLAILEAIKLDKEDATKMFGALEKVDVDHENRLRRGERWFFMGFGALAVIQFVVAFLK